MCKVLGQSSVFTDATPAGADRNARDECYTLRPHRHRFNGPHQEPGSCDDPQERAAKKIGAPLRDGRSASIRPIKSTDIDALGSFFAGLSKRTRLLRFHRLMVDFPHHLIRELSNVDGERHVAFVAEAAFDEGILCAQIVGEARYVRTADPSIAEFAIAVADSWQRLWLGSHLVRVLIADARAAAVKRFIGETLVEDAAMQLFALKFGARIRLANERDGTFHLSLDL